MKSLQSYKNTQDLYQAAAIPVEELPLDSAIIAIKDYLIASKKDKTERERIRATLTSALEKLRLDHVQAMENIKFDHNRRMRVIELLEKGMEEARRDHDTETIRLMTNMLTDVLNNSNRGQ